MLLAAVLSAIVATSAYGSSVSSASFTAGGVSVNGTRYAKQGQSLTLTVNTSSDTKCVSITGAFTAKQTSSTAKSSWTFSTTAGSGDGVQTVTAEARPDFNANNCTGQPGTGTASYVLDNTAPAVTGTLAPAANGAGWNNSNVTITWSASDNGSGVASGPAPATDSVTTETAGVTKTSTATDRLGISDNGSVSVKLDKTPPSINATRAPSPNANGWNNSDVTVSFTCSDGLSGIKSCTGGGSVVVSTEGASQSVPGTAVDNADNSNNAGVSGINIDKTPPSLSGAPTTGANGAGWYSGNVTIAWSCSDALSGIDGSCPASSTISTEGSGLTASASVSDKAGNSKNATSSPAVSIDRTPPITSATAPPSWNNVNVTVDLDANDGLSGVASTLYKVDGGAQQTYSPVTKPSFATDGVHILEFWSTDNAGNEEAHKTVNVKIDKTPPTISHSQSPAANGNGWNSDDVVVTFVCADATSGIASCTSPQTVSNEGQNQSVIGTATDNAGNSANDPASVSIDKTKPTISASRSASPNSNGWYENDVVVSFACADALSGITSCTSPQTLGEGANQMASGTAVDAAGNSQGASENGINVDKTPPSLSGAATTSPNGNGWYSGDVTVGWTCSDGLSGIDGTCPANSTIAGEGDDLSAGASVKDKAGNTRNATVGGIKIDRTAPSTLVSVPDPLDSGWYAGDVLVTLTTGPDLSGVDKTYYSVDGGGAQLYGGPFTHSQRGSHTITFWSVDNAGNVEDKTSPGHKITLKIDDIPPTITGDRAPAANSFGWNNTEVLVTFNCSDAESGIAGCDPGTTLGNEGAGQYYIGQATDNAGNTNSAKVENVNIDLTNPTLSGAATTNANAAGWYKANVTIKWTGQDGLSGIDPATQPADSVITGEGSNLGAGPVTISDKAGNPGSASINGIRIDRTPPTIGGATVNDDGSPRSANAAGWFNSAVRVRFTCNDVLSGIQECASDVVLDSDGVGQSASGTATDKADNSANASVNGIKIDSQAPSTNSDLQCNTKNGYCRGNKATLVLNASDQAGLSGVKEIRYSVNGGASQTKAGASASIDIPLNGSGVANVVYLAVDNAGNLEAPGGVEIKYDTIAPTVTHTLTPPANAAGWNKANVLVHFDAQDDPGGSGLDVSSVTPDQLFSAETAATVVNGSADDLAGNTGTDSVTVKLDKTPPTISGAPTTSPNANGWYSGPVTVKFTCADALSGIATCTADQMLTANGTNLSVNGTAVDRADHSTGTTVGGINIDSIAPSITLNGIASGGLYTLGAVPAASCSAIDGGSGLTGPCSLNVTGGLANGVGTFNFTATATDNAGNTTTKTGSYKVIYRWDGFTQPINDTAHQVDQNVSIFKAGSTVPAKFQLKRADGSILLANALPAWLTPAKGSPTTATVDESLYSDPPTAGGQYRVDGQQYIYNWGTSKGQVGYYWRVGVALDDGQTYYVNIGLR